MDDYKSVLIGFGTLGFYESIECLGRYIRQIRGAMLVYRVMDHGFN